MIELTRLGKFKVTVEFEGARYYFGCFDTTEEAAAEYNKAVAARASVFARFNFPDCTKILLDFPTRQPIVKA